MTLLLESPLLRAAGFRHGFSTRALDLALGARDHASSLARFAEAAGLGPGAVVQVEQIHGADVVSATVAAPARPLARADALVSAAGGPPIGIRVADCVPILLGDRADGGAAAVHAGWRGLVAGVISAALARLGKTPGEIVAAVGPCIGPCCFEVGSEVAERIAEAAGGPRDVIARREGDKAFVDLRSAVRNVLERSGLPAQNIEDVPGCTRCDETRFFSYRRGAETGRMLAAIRPASFPKGP